MQQRILFWLLLGGVAAVALLPPWSVRAVECELGQAISVGIGDGVILYSCSWERTPGDFVRIGPLEMRRNGILILQLQTDPDGKLQGKFSSWDDAGALTEQGQYVDGLKQGEWRITDASGDLRIVHYHRDVEVLP